MCVFTTSVVPHPNFKTKSQNNNDLRRTILQIITLTTNSLFHGDSPPACRSLSGITASSESLIFAADGAGEDDDEGVSSGDYGIDGSAPWYLRVQELAHDSLIAATRAQLARDAKASQDARAASVSNGKVTLWCQHQQNQLSEDFYSGK